jgi:fatty acid desaturase
MALADHEKRELAEIEQRLSVEDPKLAAKLARPSRLAFLSSRTLRVLGVFGVYLCGLLALIGGVTWVSVPLIVLGAVLCAGVFGHLMVRAWREHRA